MKLSEFKGDKALDALADLMEPAVEIMSDKNVTKDFKAGKKLHAIKTAIKDHKKAVTMILAILDGADPEKYEVGLITLPLKLLEVFNDPDVVNLFQSQVETTQPSSTPATVNIEEEKQ